MKKLFQIALWVILGIVIADLIYRYGFEVIEVPTSSMESTIQAGEYVMVNKLVPGPRFFSNNPDKYKRLKLLNKLNYNDLIVFNFPDADTILSNKPGESYYLLKRLHPNLDSVATEKDWGEPIALKVNKRPRMIKRITGIPGDTLSIRNGKLYVNGTEAKEQETTISTWKWLGEQEDLHKISEITNNKLKINTSQGNTLINLSNKEIAKIDTLAKLCERNIMRRGIPDPYLFPFKTTWGWNADNMGPVYLPKKGQTIKITPQNFPLYKRIIRIFEEEPIQQIGNYLFINNIPVSKYTFKLNYYWVHGDNRPNSFDSRYWGPVPENHIVGVVK